MPTIRDVAAQLGIDPSTVSRALNGDYQISSELSGLVISTAREMGYKLRGRGGRVTPDWNVSGIIVPEMLSEPYAPIVHLAQMAFRSLNYNTMVKVSGYTPQELQEALDAMEHIPARCILLVLRDADALTEETLQSIHDCAIPVVLLSSYDLSGKGLDSVCFDELVGMYSAIQHLLLRGCKKLSFIGQTKQQSELFREAMNMSFASKSAHLIRLGNAAAETNGYGQMMDILRLKKLPDAVICSSGKTAIGAIHAITAANLRIPEDMAVISLGDCPGLQYLAGGVTSITYPWETLVSAAIAALVARIDNPELTPRQTTQKPTLTRRATT